MNIIELPITILDNIFGNINDTETYSSIRISCKSFYYLMKEVKRYYNNTALKELLVFSDGELNGYHIRWYINTGLQTMVQYMNSKKIGGQTSYYPSGNIKCIQNYKEGKLNGLEKHYSNFENKLVRYCEYKNNKKINEEVSYDKYGEVLYTKTHINDHIYKLKFISIYKIIEATFVNDILHGKHIVTYLNHSNLKTFRHTKTIKTFNIGDLEAIGKYENNNLIEKKYIKNGKKHDWEFKWHTNHTLKSLGYFNNNKYDKTLKLWSDTYNLIETINFSNNLPHGTYKSKSKYIKKTIPYVNGIIDGYIIEKINCINLIYYIKFKNNEFDRIIKKQNDISCEEIFLDIDYFSFTKYKYGKKQYTFKLINDYVNMVIYDKYEIPIHTISKIINIEPYNTYV